MCQQILTKLKVQNSIQIRSAVPELLHSDTTTERERERERDSAKLNGTFLLLPLRSRLEKLSDSSQYDTQLLRQIGQNTLYDLPIGRQK